MDVVDHSQLEGQTYLRIALELWRRGIMAPLGLELLGDLPQMAHSIEGRVPFLSHRLWQWVPYLPWTFEDPTRRCDG